MCACACVTAIALGVCQRQGEPMCRAASLDPGSLLRPNLHMHGSHRPATGSGATSYQTVSWIVEWNGCLGTLCERAEAHSSHVATRPVWAVKQIKSAELNAFSKLTVHS